MALPVVNINVNYDSEKGESPVTVNLPLLSRSLERIGDFLSTFVAKDIEQDLADLDLEDEPTHNRYKGLKYMTQMVCVEPHKTRFRSNCLLTATNCEP